MLAPFKEPNHWLAAFKIATAATLAAVPTFLNWDPGFGYWSSVRFVLCPTYI